MIRRPYFRVIDPNDPIDVRVTAKLNREAFMCGYRREMESGNEQEALRYYAEAQRYVW